MTQGSNIPLEVHYIIIQLSSIMKPDNIAVYMGISPHAVNCILGYFAIHGAVKGEKDHKTREGNLCDMDLQVSLLVCIITIIYSLTMYQFLFGSIQQSPDLYLDEPKEILSTTCGQDVQT